MRRLLAGPVEKQSPSLKELALEELEMGEDEFWVDLRERSIRKMSGMTHPEE